MAAFAGRDDLVVLHAGDEFDPRARGRAVAIGVARGPRLGTVEWRAIRARKPPEPVARIPVTGVEDTMAKTDFKSVDEYIATHPHNVQAILQSVRKAIRKGVPS